EPVLVLGAAGGMGVVLVQLLHAAGAFVVGAARGKAKLDVVDEAGADVAVDYDGPGWTRAVLDATHGAGPIAVLDGVGGPLGHEAFDILRDGGRFSAHGAPSGSFAPIDTDIARRRHVTITTLADLAADPTPRHQLIREAVALVAADTVNPLIGQTFPLRDADQAHAAMAARETIAKTLLLVD
ncbi:MAG TPA: zinc-binding dehydrogenase, partial [Acidimicrobiales bacterium]